MGSREDDLYWDNKVWQYGGEDEDYDENDELDENMEPFENDCYA
jgi:hypothetical protein